MTSRTHLKPYCLLSTVYCLRHSIPKHTRLDHLEDHIRNHFEEKLTNEPVVMGTSSNTILTIS